MTKALLKLETVVLFPVFLLSWLLAGVWVSVRAGVAVANMGDDEKAAVLHKIFGKSE